MTEEITEVNNKKKISLSNLLRRFIPFTLYLTILSFINYGVGYIFLYGFLIGGNLNKQNITIIDLFINPAPFNFYGVNLMGLFILISVLLLSLLFLMIVKSQQKLVYITISLLVFLVFQYFLTLFLINGFDEFLTVIYFKSFVIWVFPLVLILTVVFPIISIYRWPSGISGFSIGVLLLIISNFIDRDLLEGMENVASIIIITSSSVTMLTANLRIFRWRNYFFYKILVIVPTLVLVLLVIYLVFDSIKLGTYIGLILIFTIPITLMILKLSKLKPKPLLNQRDYIKKFFSGARFLNARNSESKLLILVLIILFFTTVIPQFLYESGKYVRFATNSIKVCVEQPPSVYKETIEVGEQSYVGYVISETDSVYYIADKNWEMRRIKGRDIQTYATPNSKIIELCKENQMP